MNIKPEQVPQIFNEARTAARAATERYSREKLNGRDALPCGFSWVNIYGIRANSQLGKALKNCEVTKSSFEKSHVFWNPSGTGYQNVDVKEAGARAACDVLRRYGFDAHVNSRLD